MVNPTRVINNIYEINTPVYLEKLSRTHDQAITLATLPDDEIRRIASYGCDAIWLMGVWKRSPLAVDIALHDQPLLDEIRGVLPDFQPIDMIGSAYAISAYEVEDAYGGEAELVRLRARLAEYGLKLILDFVPNHTAFDHNWITSHSEYYVFGTDTDSVEHPMWYTDIHGNTIAHGRDPHFDAWPDVAQLNAFAESYRQASIDTLTSIASLCDGVRCDMAMLMTNDVFAQTWGKQVGAAPATEYWQDVIAAIRAHNKDFTFIAECYWNMQATLINQGFDYCYDKDMYDFLVAGDIEAAQTQVETQSAIAEHLLHFLENHDEPRAARVFDINAHRTALHYILSLPGPRLWHDRQFEGYQKKLPVHIGRGPNEPTDEDIATMYRDALQH